MLSFIDHVLHRLPGIAVSLFKFFLLVLSFTFLCLVNVLSPKVFPLCSFLHFHVIPGLAVCRGDGVEGKDILWQVILDAQLCSGFKSRLVPFCSQIRQRKMRGNFKGGMVGIWYLDTPAPKGPRNTPNQLAATFSPEPTKLQKPLLLPKLQCKEHGKSGTY